MTDITSAFNRIQEEEVSYNKAVSESLMKRIGANQNFLYDFLVQDLPTTTHSVTSNKTWICPEIVGDISVVVVGGGGGGGGVGNGGAGGGGAGGGIFIGSIRPIIGATYTLTAGSGGAGGGLGSGSAGGTSVFSCSEYSISAYGGNGGITHNSSYSVGAGYSTGGDSTVSSSIEYPSGCFIRGGSGGIAYESGGGASNGDYAIGFRKGAVGAATTGGGGGASWGNGSNGGTTVGGGGGGILDAATSSSSYFGRAGGGGGIILIYKLHPDAVDYVPI
jgi:hypothetical protein